MLNVIVGVVGLVIGGFLFNISGAVAGFFLGFLFGEIARLKNRIKKLEERLQEGASLIDHSISTEDTPEPEEINADFESSDEDEFDHYPVDEDDLVLSQPLKTQTVDKKPAVPSLKKTLTAKSTDVSIETNVLEKGIQYIIDFFTTGNVVAKVGVIILFFGVAFLLKYAAQRNLFPIEARLISVAISAIAMLVVGWRVRITRLMYGLILQGGGIGILYLNLFATARHYELMPITLAFGIMVGLVILSAFLAVLHDSRALACFGTIGGFLAPVLMSTGTGNHIVLFSYYALLNAGIFGIAWFKAWREINLIGFVFTFVIGALWGERYYQHTYFMSVEPFLVLSFLFYVAISILFAFRQPLHLKGYVDSTLVFGTPLVVFALQHGLVHNFEYGLAISAFVMSGLYILLATALWRRNVEGMRMLTESFLALAVVFGSLAIPLALDGRWTTASWSLEGAALVWVGIRQNRLLARHFGLLLIVGANVSFLVSNNEPTGTIPVLNGLYLSCLLISMAALISSYLLHESKDKLKTWEQQYHIFTLILGLIWWYASGIHELERQVPTKDLYNGILIFVSMSCIIKSLVAHRLDWLAMKMPSIGFLPAMALVLIGSYIDVYGYHPFFRFGIFAWISAFGVHYFLLILFEEAWPRHVVSWWHKGSLWLMTLVLTLEASWWFGKLVAGAWTWEFVAFGLIPSAVIVMLLSKGRKLKWPVIRFEKEYLGQGTGMLILYLFLWNMTSCALSGTPDPLPYVPVLNPLDLIQLLVILLIIWWAWLVHQEKLPLDFFIQDKFLVYAPACIFFIWMNAAIARSVHHFGGIAYTPDALFKSVVFHAAISISWSLAALFITVWATRKGFREVWFTGAALLSLVVLKLFMVDLASSGTVARIVSFLVVGCLMLLIGYLSPLPTSRQEEEKT